MPGCSLFPSWNHSVKENSKKQCKEVTVVVHHQHPLLEFGTGDVQMRLAWKLYSPSLSLSPYLNLQDTWCIFCTQVGMKVICIVDCYWTEIDQKTDPNFVLVLDSCWVKQIRWKPFPCRWREQIQITVDSHILHSVDAFRLCIYYLFGSPLYLGGGGCYPNNYGRRAV